MEILKLTKTWINEIFVSPVVVNWISFIKYIFFTSMTKHHHHQQHITNNREKFPTIFSFPQWKSCICEKCMRNGWLKMTRVRGSQMLRFLFLFSPLLFHSSIVNRSRFKKRSSTQHSKTVQGDERNAHSGLYIFFISVFWNICLLACFSHRIFIVLEEKFQVSFVYFFCCVNVYIFYFFLFHSILTLLHHQQAVTTTRAKEKFYTENFCVFQWDPLCVMLNKWKILYKGGTFFCCVFGMMTRCSLAQHKSW